MKTIMLIVLIGIGSMQNVKAQFWEKLAKKAEEKIEKEAEKRSERRVNQKIDKTFDKAENTIDNKTKKKEKSKKKKNKVQDYKVYTFNKSVEMEVIEEGKKQHNYLESFLSDSTPTISCLKINTQNQDQFEGMYILFGGEDTAMFMDMGVMKIKKSISNKQLEKYDNSSQVNNVSITKTGKTKSILGYNCKEYLAKTDDTTASIWATTDNFPFKGNYVPILGMKDSSKNSIDGFVLEINSKAKNNNSTIRVTKININKKFTLNTSEYKSMLGGN